jgi:hypothetical protein
MSKAAWRTAVLGLALGGSLSCDSLENRLKTCRTLRVELVNALPSEGGINIAAESEPFSDATFLPAVAGGSTRSLDLCVEKGDRKLFKAAYGQRIVAEANCVVSFRTDELQAVTSRVVWSNRGLLCEGW